MNEYLRLGGFPIVALGNFDERSLSVEAVYNYLSWLEEAFVICRAMLDNIVDFELRQRGYEVYSG